MNLGAVLLFVLIYTLLGFIFQRSDPNKRPLVGFCLFIMAVLTQRYADYRLVSSEAWLGLAVALLLNGLFWLMIGRYNPVDADKIQVIGMDD